MILVISMERMESAVGFPTGSFCEIQNGEQVSVVDI